MKIVKIDSYRMKEHPRELIIEIHTDVGIVGLGETNAKPGAVQSLIHEMCADILLGQDPQNIESIWSTFYTAFNHHGCSGTEMRALSAIDIALWDIKGKISGQPLYQLLGGKSRDTVKVYNTCVGYLENNDRDRFIHQPEKLAEELLESGIDVMKIWPFDELSAEFRGQYITKDLMKKGLEPFRKIKETFGDKMQIALEGHGRWNVTAAINIARELEQYDPLWIEDLIAINNIDNLVELRKATSIPIGASERLFTRYGYQELLEKRGGDIVIADPAWTGGVTEVKKIASLAEVYGLPFAPHNCGGPILHTVNAHICFNIPNLWMMETVRAFYDSYYDDIVTGVPRVVNGYITGVSEYPGLGVELRKEFYERSDLIHRTSTQQKGKGEGKVYNVTGIGDPWKR
ncbi:mandelate racemase/muconate lactonizing enzyme family protein [Oceanobacillus bengalensis]|uniref:Mandelate racemase/muconate lactonizing enzyme family protein n=1 Tax=Oceanobacillus bengalensis TaxID=1435466 RepID=A0A494YTZ4_9BACI|nr:mandelate racemase/muconate lactonizing enzyme family protein [Oceanobacillus bengalensis]RKQ13566.1 mandelate racemase/muconate lactonizing enzyme family protein [Oceanobacillus bengalensis]